MKPNKIFNDIIEGFNKSQKLAREVNEEAEKELNIIDRERIIEKIQKINCNQRNNIHELAILDNKELLERLNELTKTQKK